MLENRKILITGNMGYIGPSIQHHLRKTKPGSTLIGLDCGYFAHCLAGADGRVPETLLDYQIFCDIRDVTDDVFEDVWGVVHLAAISNDPMGNSFERATRQINHEATIDVARRAKAAGATVFIFASSCSIYGAAGDAPRTESAPLNPLTAYAQSKVASELDLATIADSQFRITCLRFPTACGMSERLRLDLVLNDFVASALATGKIKVLSDGTPWRPMIDVRDMANAVGWALDRRSDQGGNFLAVNVGKNEWNYRVSDLANIVGEVCGGAKVSINTDAPPDNRSYKVNFDLFQTLAPPSLLMYDLNSTIESLKAGLEKISFNDEDFRESQWIRLNVLRDYRMACALDDGLRWMG